MLSNGLSVLQEIRLEYEAGIDISYSKIEKSNLSLLRRACKIFGNWETAITRAGIDYNKVRKYNKWTKELIIEKIKEHHKNGVDLSWYNISHITDQQLAAAALHGHRFKSWNDALIEAGLDPTTVSKYKRWTKKRIFNEIKEYALERKPLDRNSLNEKEPTLLAAIYRLGDGLVIERDRVFKSGELPQDILELYKDLDVPKPPDYLPQDGGKRRKKKGKKVMVKI